MDHDASSGISLVEAAMLNDYNWFSSGTNGTVGFSVCNHCLRPIGSLVFNVSVGKDSWFTGCHRNRQELGEEELAAIAPPVESNWRSRGIEIRVVRRC